ncbi:iron uptake system protein EfeO [Corynebacterium anserum]|uniref:Peptidase M75 n=1 Tax=Corynebacterium anserum TaxID=2684406 RepID=A0A7G7YP14_9CORY|nr:iron uptake system protein EfeO [Corynebacterium anserum]MBC2681835.1 peptidase M75 [Corynebacterium anserum]QNH96234.1 peptidase M75 [Corynebacterium anserum]
MRNTRRYTTPTLALVPLIALGASLTACADKADLASATNIEVKADDTSCTLTNDQASTGTVTFDIANSGSKINEFYITTNNGRVLGEVENIGPGASRKLVVEFQEAGTYTTLCKPGMVGEGIKGQINVTGDAVNLAEGDAALQEAVDNYTTYVRAQATTLNELTPAFVQAIKSGDINKAKKLYAQVRTPYERIEPVAESFPNDLDPRIDLREADLAEGDTWTGFHPIEKALWKEGKIDSSTKKLADQLSKDIQELVDGVNSKDFQLTPTQIASGAQGLLDEVATSKITGEEDIFSHTDLYDFQANVEGSKAAVAALERSLEEKKPGMLAEINKRFDSVQAELNKYRQGEGFISYDKVSESQRKGLSVALDHLSEEVAKVQHTVVD